VRKTKHFAALSYYDIGSFMADLRQQQSVYARALEFLILTASRPGEVVGAEWQELNVEQRIWTIPAIRMKSGKAHRLPLSQAAMDLIQGMRNGRRDRFVFPGRTYGRPVSSDALLVLLKRMGRPDLTAHGFRSTFRDWAAECTDAPNEVAEMALGHAVGNKVEIAYRRGDLFEKRRRLMEAWAEYCGMARQIPEILSYGQKSIGLKAVTGD
jgi:integrase